MVAKEQIEKCVDVAKRYGVRRLVLFGSAAENPLLARDIDLLCEGIDDSDFVRMGAEMEEMARTVVDVVSTTPVTRFTKHVLSKGRVLYER